MMSVPTDGFLPKSLKTLIKSGMSYEIKVQVHFEISSHMVVTTGSDSIVPDFAQT